MPRIMTLTPDQEHPGQFILKIRPARQRPADALPVPHDPPTIGKVAANGAR